MFRFFMPSSLRRSAPRFSFASLCVLAGGRLAQAGNAVLYVDIDAPPGGDGLSWATALNGLEQARQIADPNGAGATTYGQVWVAEGTYKPSTIYGGDPRQRFFVPTNDPAYPGGVAGNETMSEQRVPVAHPTVLSGDINAPGNISDNCYHFVFSTSGIIATAVMDGFTITGGNANASDDRGGGW